MHAFGLSTSEVVRIQPHEDDFGEVLQVNRPANLPRFVPVTTHQQRELLDAARRVTPPGGVLSALPERCPEQSRRRLVYMSRRAAGLEVDQGCSVRDGRARRGCEDSCWLEQPIPHAAPRGPFPPRARVPRQFPHERAKDENFPVAALAA
jgi:hypothetical protein